MFGHWLTSIQLLPSLYERLGSCTHAPSHPRTQPWGICGWKPHYKIISYDVIKFITKVKKITFKKFVHTYDFFLKCIKFIKFIKFIKCQSVTDPLNDNIGYVNLMKLINLIYLMKYMNFLKGGFWWV